MSLGLRQNPTSQAFAAGTSITPTGLTTIGWASGDVILAFVEVVSTATCTPATSSTGWNTTGTIQQSTTGVVSALFWLKYNGTSYTTPTITWTGSYKSSVKFVVLSGADGTTPISATTTNSGSGTAMTAKTATSTRRGSLRLCMFFKATTATAFSAISADINQLEQANVGTATATGRFGLFAQWNMAENAAGDKLATQTTTASWVAWTVWVQPAVADQFGILRVTQAGTRGSANTSKTATLASADVVGTNTGTTIAVYGAAFNSTLTATIGGVAPTAGPSLSIAASIASAGWYAYNQTATGGTAVNVVLTRASGSDSIEVFAIEFLGGATSVSPFDQKGAQQSAGGATSNAVSTSAATASGTEFSVYSITDDAGAGALTADTNYNTNNAQQSGSTSAIPLLNASRQFTGGSTETATSTTAASNSLALIMTFAAPAVSQAISGRVAGTAPGPSALSRPPLSGCSAQPTSKTETGLITPIYSGAARYSTVSSEHGLSYSNLLGRSVASQTLTEHALPSSPMNGRSSQSQVKTDYATPAPPAMAGRSPGSSGAKGLSIPRYSATSQGRTSPLSNPLATLLGKASGLSALSGKIGPSHLVGRAANFSPRGALTPTTNLGSPTGGGVSLLDRAALSTWRSLGALSADVFHESDILFADGYYYVLNTSADASLGDPHIGWRRATTLEGIVSASGSDRVERALNTLYYPSFDKDGSDWRVIGTVSTVTTYYNKYTGSAPPAWVDGGTVKLGTTFGVSTVPLIDMAIRKNPYDGFFYVVGLDDSQPLPYPVYLHRTKTPDTQNTWRRVGGNIFTGGYPSWASSTVFDPNLMFVDGRAYLGFSGGDGTILRSGIIEINPNTALPISAPLVLNSDGLYPWQPQLLSDLVFLRCPDGVDRIFGFANGPYDGSVNGVWGCLDLQASAARWYFSGPSVRGLAHPYARAISQGAGSALSAPGHSLVGRSVGRALSSLAPSTHFFGRAAGSSRSAGSAVASLTGRAVGKAASLVGPSGNLLGRSAGRTGAYLSPLGNLLGRSAGSGRAAMSGASHLAGRAYGRANSFGSMVSSAMQAMTGRSVGSSGASASSTPTLAGRSAGRATVGVSPTGPLSGRAAGMGVSKLASVASMVGRAVAKSAAHAGSSAALVGRSAGKGASSLLGRGALKGQGTGRGGGFASLSAPNMVAMAGRAVGSSAAQAVSRVLLRGASNPHSGVLSHPASSLSGRSSGSSGSAARPLAGLAGRAGRTVGSVSGVSRIALRGMASGATVLRGRGPLIEKLRTVVSSIERLLYASSTLDKAQKRSSVTELTTSSSAVVETSTDHESQVEVLFDSSVKEK